jgi:hypothetical protein
MPAYDHQHKASRVEVAIKWISSFVILLLFGSCLVFSKISLLALSSAMHASNDNLDRDARCRMFVMLQIISVVPHVINLIRGVWKCVLRRDRKWPKGKVMIFAVNMLLLLFLYFKNIRQYYVYVFTRIQCKNKRVVLNEFRIFTGHSKISAQDLSNERF